MSSRERSSRGPMRVSGPPPERRPGAPSPESGPGASPGRTPGGPLEPNVDLLFLNPSSYFDAIDAPAPYGLFGLDYYPPLSLMALAANLSRACPEARWRAIDTAVRYTEPAALAEIRSSWGSAQPTDYHRAASARAEVGRYVVGRRVEVRRLLAEDVRALRPAIVAVPFHYTSEIARARRLLEVVREHGPSATCVVGGAHATALADAILDGVPHVDVVALGEAEETLVELVRWRLRGGRAAELESIAGIAYRHEGRVRRTKPRPAVLDVDRYPHPYEASDAFDLAARERLVALMPWLTAMVGNVVHRDPSESVAQLVTSRGCVFACPFCANERLCGRRVRAHSADYVVDMVRDVTERLGTRSVYFGDAVFGLDAKRLGELARRLGPLGLTGYCQTAVEILDDRRLDALQELGVYSVALGIETLNPSVPIGTKGRMTLSERRRRIAGIQRRGMKAVGTFIVGLPGESLASMIRTAILARRLGLERASFFPLVAVPGTPVYDRLVASVAPADRRSTCPWAPEDYLYTVEHGPTLLRFVAYLSQALFRGEGILRAPRHAAALLRIAREQRHRDR